MRTLTVHDFSCVTSATLELGKVTLIIGPQASGKSILSKLCFFLLEIPSTQAIAITRGENFEKFSAAIKKRFVEWFPVSAWGTRKFSIELVAEGYSVALTRKSYGGATQDDFRIKFSPAFKIQYENLYEETAKLDRKSDEIESRFQLDFRIHDSSRQSIKRLMLRDAVLNQVFVPAGRSFFTSMGKAIAVFEQSKAIDPLIIRFGRMYTSFRENHFYYPNEKVDNASKTASDEIFKSLMGGALEREDDQEYLRSADGRLVPVSAMSSGQQELLPLFTIMPWMFSGASERICYIEEPEAHLFPFSQGQLVQALVIGANAPGQGPNLVMTTHSPYVLTKLNNLLKAGALSVKEAKRKSLEGILHRRSWLRARNVRAYALHEGILTSIMDSDGYIDGDYLDTASNELSKEFDRLLALED